MVRYVNFATLVLLLLNVADSADATQQVRGSRRRLLQQNPCVLVQRHVLFKHPDSHSESERHVWACKLQGDDVKNAHARLVELDKAAKAALDKDPNIRSGHTTLMIDGAEITEDKTLKFPKGISITQHLGKKDAITSATNSRRRHHHRRGLNEVTTPDDGPHKVLAIRVEAKDSSTTASKNRLGDDIFGLGDDQINLSSRFDACSYGQLQFEPYNGATTGGPTITDGVYELSMDNYNVVGVRDFTAEKAVVEAAEAKLGNLEEQFDYVMICLPVRMRFCTVEREAPHFCLP